MSPLPDLTHVASLPELERVFTELGIGRKWHHLEPGAIAGARGAGPVAVHAAGTSLPWLLVTARDGRAAARALARARLRLGAPAAIAVLDPAARSLVLTVALSGSPQLAIPLASPDPVATGVLSRLPGLREVGALEGAALLAEWLATEPVGTRFFRQFRRTFEAMQLALPAGPCEADRAALALLQLTRVLFLYFVQGKGWLDGRPDFLASHVDDALRRRRDVHRHVLKPLWFGTLNQPSHQRSAAAAKFGRIPFLNGGLFEPHPLERRWRSELPADNWRAAFDELFERFQFITREGDANAIGPDTLGHVFEGLMAPDLRHQTGSYYTPAHLVLQVLERGLAACIAQRQGIEIDEASSRISGRDADALTVLRGITVLDPAAGSGAFLLGALELLASWTREEGETPAAARRRVLERNLFGVDLNPAAVRLAELRLWLAVIADEPEGVDADVAPLPNLDAVVRQGDSLWDRLGGRLHPDAASADDVRKARARLLGASGQRKRQSLKALRSIELKAAQGSVAAALAAAEAAIRSRLDDARSPTLFGEQRGLTRADREWLASMRQERRRLRQVQRLLDRGGQLEHFDYAIQFADVMEHGGFDLVAGNPPWVRGEAIPTHVRQALARRYRWYRGAGTVAYRNGADLSVAFIERSLELARKGGALALLVPAKIAQAGYATALRHGLVATTTLQTVASVSEADARAFGATVYPMALVAAKATAAPGHRVATSLEGTGAQVVQEALHAPGPWILAGQACAAAVQRVRASHPRLGETWKVQVGVKTGADDVFLTRDPDIEPSLLRHAIRGRDLSAEGIQSVLWLRWPCDSRGAPLPTLPPRAQAWFRRNADRLRRRADYRDGPAWRLFRTGAAVSPYRVIWPDLARHLNAFVLDPTVHARWVPLNTCYVIAPADAYLAGRIALLLNSTWFRAIARHAAPIASGGYRRYSARVVEDLPLPQAALVEATGAATHHDIDLQVADWLGLTRDERDALADLSAARG